MYHVLVFCFLLLSGISLDLTPFSFRLFLAARLWWWWLFGWQWQRCCPCCCLLSLSLIPGWGAGHRPNPFQVAPEASRIGCEGVSWPGVPPGMIVGRTLERQMLDRLVGAVAVRADGRVPARDPVKVSCYQWGMTSAYLCHRHALVPGPITLPTLVTVLAACKTSMDPGMWIAEVPILIDALLMPLESCGSWREVHFLFAVCCSDDSGRPRPGYMGHLTRIANHLVNSSGTDGVGDSSAATSALLLGLLIASRLSFSQSVNLYSAS